MPPTTDMIPGVDQRPTAPSQRVRLSWRTAYLPLSIAVVLTGCAARQVPVSVAPADHQGPTRSGQAAIYARNALSTDVWLAVTVDAEVTSRFSAPGRQVSGGCHTMSAGADVLLLGRERDNLDGSTSILGPDLQAEPQVLWLDLAADGTWTAGTGTPAWWTPAPPLAC
jgi:hypothetical protein